MGFACPVDNASALTRWIPNSASWRGLRVAAPSRCLWEKVFDNPKNVPSADGGETFSGSKTHPNCFIKLVKSVQLCDLDVCNKNPIAGMANHLRANATIWQAPD